MKFRNIIIACFCLSVTVTTAQQMPPGRVIAFGTAIDPATQQKASAQLAASLANAKSTTWRAKGDQKRIYHFADANIDMPYRLYIPAKWDGKAILPLVLFL